MRSKVSLNFSSISFRFFVLSIIKKNSCLRCRLLTDSIFLYRGIMSRKNLRRSGGVQLEETATPQAMDT